MYVLVYLLGGYFYIFYGLSNVLVLLEVICFNVFVVVGFYVELVLLLLGDCLCLGDCDVFIV